MDHIFPANDTMENGFNAVADAILSLNVAPAPYPEWDAAKREFTVKSILRWLSSESDGIWYYGGKKTDTYEVRVFGFLWNGSYAGLGRASLGNGPGGSWWNNASRVSPNGRNRVNADVPPQAA